MKSPLFARIFLNVLEFLFASHVSAINTSADENFIAAFSHNCFKHNLSCKWSNPFAFVVSRSKLEERLQGPDCLF